MDPLIATMDQSSIGNKTKKLTSGPTTKEQSSKLIHKTDKEITSPIILSHSNVMPALFDDFPSKNTTHRIGNNHCNSNNHREYDDHRSRDIQKPLDDDSDDSKDVVIVTEPKSKDVSKNHDSGITESMECLAIQRDIKINDAKQSKRYGSKDMEGISSKIQTTPNSIALNRSRTTVTTTTTTTAITVPTSCIPKNRDLPEACHQQPPPPQPPTSSSPTSAFAQKHRNAVASNGLAKSTVQQRRLPPIVKAQSLDYARDSDVVDQIHPHFQNCHYMYHYHHRHHHHRSHLHNQHPHNYHHASNHSPSSSSDRKQETINKGCSLDNQRSEDEDVPGSTGVIDTPTTDDVDADVDDDDDDELTSNRVATQTAASARSRISEGNTTAPLQRGSGSTANRTDSAQQTDVVRLSSPQPRQHNLTKGVLPKVQSLESRPIYPNVPYSPYASPYGSPRSNRRRTPLRESRRISIEQSGSFLQLNQYKLMDQIGQGSYGLVKLAYSEEDSTHYAMKILSKRRLLRKAGLMSRGPKKTTSPLDRVYREIAVLKKLDHPNVVKLVEVLDDPLEDSLYLVFELVKQGEVLEIPTETPLTEERAWSVFRDAVLGLEYLHYQRIIHADIKPGNLLLTECGHVKIADLGVCNEFLGEDATMNNGSTAGTPAFRAPETLFPGQHLYSGKAADIWALGATLYSLVYGNVPFVASSVPLLYEKIKNEALMIPEKPLMSEELVDLIKKMLTKDPAKRITLPQIKEHRWVTANGVHILPSEDDNCRLVQVSEEDINSVVKSIPKLDTLILIKTMLKNHSFLNPFSRGISGRAPQRGGSRLERFTRAGRSNSAPGAYHSPIDRQLSGDCILPALSEHGVSSSSDIPEDT